jgi:DNA end-binding protein Ku
MEVAPVRSLWKGTISFGLVTIPVKLYAATEEKGLHFNLLHEECRTPIQYRKFCPTCEREVAAEEIVKGYEFEKGRYVLVTEEELASIPVAAKKTVEILDFVDLTEIDPVFYDKTYYLEPGEGGAKAYALLRRAMAETGKIAMAKVIIRSKESLAAIRLFKEGVLAMETMYFPDEVRSTAGLSAIAEPALKPQELAMARDLILSLSMPFDPGKYQNEYRDAVLEVIAAKAHGEEAVQPVEKPERGRVVDLMAALRASIRAAEEARGKRGAEAGAMPVVAPAVAAQPDGAVPAADPVAAAAPEAAVPDGVIPAGEPAAAVAAAQPSPEPRSVPTAARRERAVPVVARPAVAPPAAAPAVAAPAVAVPAAVAAGAPGAPAVFPPPLVTPPPRSPAPGRPRLTGVVARPRPPVPARSTGREVH